MISANDDTHVGNQITMAMEKGSEVLVLLRRDSRSRTNLRSWRNALRQ